MCDMSLKPQNRPCLVFFCHTPAPVKRGKIPVHFLDLPCFPETCSGPAVYGFILANAFWVLLEVSRFEWQSVNLYQKRFLLTMHAMGRWSEMILRELTKMLSNLKHFRVEVLHDPTVPMTLPPNSCCGCLAFKRKLCHSPCCWASLRASAVLLEWNCWMEAGHKEHKQKLLLVKRQLECSWHKKGRRKSLKKRRRSASSHPSVGGAAPPPKLGILANFFPETELTAIRAHVGDIQMSPTLHQPQGCHAGFWLLFLFLMQNELDLESIQLASRVVSPVFTPL